MPEIMKFIERPVLRALVEYFLDNFRVDGEVLNPNQIDRILLIYNTQNRTRTRGLGLLYFNLIDLYILNSNGLFCPSYDS